MEKVLLLFFILVVPVQARIGWTRKQMQKKYGKYIGKRVAMNQTVYTYFRGRKRSKDYVVITVVFNKKTRKAKWVAYKLYDLNKMEKDWSKSEVKGLLRLNKTKSQRWRLEEEAIFSKTWKRTDGVIANSTGNRIIFITERFYKSASKNIEETERKHIEEEF